MVSQERITQCLLDFQKFLQGSWPSLPRWITFPIEFGEPINDWLNDWFQANWEILVEYPLSQVEVKKLTPGHDFSAEDYDSISVIRSNYIALQIYGDGADGFSGRASSRMLFPELNPVGQVMAGEGLIFHSFGTLNEGYFWQGHPFDKVKTQRLSDREDIILDPAKCNFQLMQISET